MALVDEVLAAKKLTKRTELCKQLGYPVERCVRGWEAQCDAGFGSRFSQYLAGWHPDALARLPSLWLVFPHLAKMATPTSASELWQALESACDRSVPDLSPATKKWIVSHLLPVSPSQAASTWALEHRSPVLVAWGERRMHHRSALVRTMAHLLGAQHVFLAEPPGLAISSLQFLNALTFLGFANVLIVLNEFQTGGAASTVKLMQDQSTRSTRDFGMLLFSTTESVARETATQVFYSVRGVHVVREPLADWMLDEPDS